jgi:hypothetical protein
MYKTDLVLTRFIKASFLPSGETCGLAAPPGPPVIVVFLPVSKSYLLIT